MKNAFSYLTPSIEALTVSPKMIQLFIPPIKWHGDPKGHIGTYDTFFFVISGECSLIIDGSSTILRAGDLAFLPKGKMRAYANMSSEITLYEMNFDAVIDGQNWFSMLNSINENYVVRTEFFDYVKGLFEDSVRYELNKDLMYDVILCSNLLNLIRVFIIEKNRLDAHESPFQSVTDYVKSNLENTIKISELSSLVFMEETYFIKKFKKAFGDSPITYINKLRIYKSMSYLADTNLSLSDIGNKVGIHDSSYFSKIFKTHCGITPGEYRNIFNK